jgi:anti-sigma factor RsiW
MNAAKILLRELDGTLSPEEILELERTVDSRPEFAVKRRHWHRIAQELGSARAVSFGPLFGDRVLMRLRESRQSAEDTIYAHLRWMFTRVAMAGVALALILGTYNAAGVPEFSGSIVETLFGLPAPTLEAAVMLADT